jgi:hypothetical protein
MMIMIIINNKPQIQIIYITHAHRGKERKGGHAQKKNTGKKKKKEKKRKSASGP